MSAFADMPFFDACRARIANVDPLVVRGRVRAVVGHVIEGEGLDVQVGSVCRIEDAVAATGFHAEVVGFRDDRFLLMPLGEAAGVGPGWRIRPALHGAGVPDARACIGRVIDGLAQPIDGGAALPIDRSRDLSTRPTPPLARARIESALELGVRGIDTLLTTARGARVGLFAGSGVGKSTLLGQIARRTTADVIVMAMIGERGREVREFVEGQLGPEALARSIVVVATSDETALLRKRAATLATGLAEQLRDEGRDVLLLMDSVTRFCHAQREIGLAAGEPPTTRGYPPSLWTALPRLLERAGTGAGTGSITAIYTVLVENDDMNEPVADALRALLDGHVVLSRDIASRGRHPAIDILQSVSRLMPDVVAPEHLALAERARSLMATYRDAEDLISIGAYVAGSNPAIDEAQRLHGPLETFLRQRPDEVTSLEQGVGALAGLIAPNEPTGASA